jgi:general stress protein 26
MLVPLDDIADFAWRALGRGADDPSHPMHMLTLATVGPDGRPSARLMINRGAEREGHAGRVWLHTDARSPKVAELHGVPFACLSAWDSGAGIHLRVHGRVVLHRLDECARRHWEQLSSAARWLYETPSDGADVAAGGEPPDLRLPRDKRQLPHKLTARERDRFTVIEVRVETIDWLQATQTEMRRAVMHADGGWVARAA